MMKFDNDKSKIESKFFTLRSNTKSAAVSCILHFICVFFCHNIYQKVYDLFDCLKNINNFLQRQTRNPFLIPPFKPFSRKSVPLQSHTHTCRLVKSEQLTLHVTRETI